MTRNLTIVANSRKMGNRCIAGIDADTSEWVRPCFGTGEQGVPWSVRQVDRAEPQLLDIVAIPLGSDGPHRDIQPENRRILNGAWKRLGKATVNQVARHCQKAGLILHNSDRRIHVSLLRTVPKEEKKSLCLIQANVAFFTEATYRGSRRVNARFNLGSNEYCLPVTDYEYERHFPRYGRTEAECLLTISLGAPYERDSCCYKFVAGVIVL